MTERHWPLRPAGVAPVGRSRDVLPPRSGDDAVVRPAGSGEIRATTAVAVPIDRARAALRIIAPAAVISAVVVVGMSLGSNPLSLVGAGLALLAAVAAPQVGLAILAALAPIQPPIPAPGLSFLLVGALLMGCIYRLPIDRPELRLSKSGLLLLGFVVYIAAQQLPALLSGYSGELGHTIGYLFIQVMAGFGLIVVAGYILRDRSPIAVLTMAFAGVLLAVVVAVATFENPVSGPPFARLVATTEIGVRAAGPFGNPNYLGTFAVAALVGILGVWTAVSSRLGRTLLVGLAVFCFVALVQAQSRGAIVAGFAGIAAIVWLRSRPLALAIVGTGVVAAVLIYPAFVEWRLTNLRGTVSDAGYVAMTESDDARLQATLAGPAMFVSEPIFGVGFGEFVEKSVTVSGLETGINAHNWYVNVLAEQGITGGLLWLGATLAVAVELRARRGAARLVGVGVFTTLAAGFLFLEGPTSFQLIAVPSLFLVAALVSDWGDGRIRPAGMNAVAEPRGT